MTGRARFPPWRAGSGTATPLVPTIVQDDRDGAVLLLAWSNRASYAELRKSRQLVLFSRSRQQLWRKGESSGHTARVVQAAWDCDDDALLLRVIPNGPMCHTGTRSCFGADWVGAEGQLPPALHALAERIDARHRSQDPDSYTVALWNDDERRLKKVGEEAVELVVAASRRDRSAMIRESADLLYHVSVLLHKEGVDWSEVFDLLVARQTSGRRRAAPAPARLVSAGSAAAALGASPRARGRARRARPRPPR
ncbi:MAG: bifunctional phosphoribosyl-AMP cyclohydrolase/phosphoribosyl-ATP diphosphatase HisIE [Thermoplasmata archaeon]|nr:bifunctional phosphoribosyl-AMP cyclohydrolase/phosphoribosyl-ATP diphosphatase HisIE [Thermoplasmata archaeon]